jgi:hypothetical protein
VEHETVPSIQLLVSDVRLCDARCSMLTDDRVYYMFANIANLNNWRRERGFCESAVEKRRPWTLALTSCESFRHFCSPSTRGGSRGHRPSDVSVPHIALDLTRYPAAQGPRVAISVLFEADRDRNESAKQQRAVLDIREKSVERVLQDGVERQPEHG